MGRAPEPLALTLRWPHASPFVPDTYYSPFYLPPVPNASLSPPCALRIRSSPAHIRKSTINKQIKSDLRSALCAAVVDTTEQARGKKRKRRKSPSRSRSLPRDFKMRRRKSLSPNYLLPPVWGGEYHMHACACPTRSPRYPTRRWWIGAWRGKPRQESRWVALLAVCATLDRVLGAGLGVSERDAVHTRKQPFTALTPAA
jgi:hypothetical protein